MHTPKDYADVYAKTPYWKDFYSIVGDISGIENVVNDSWHVIVENGSVTINGVEDNAVVTIYTIGGVLQQRTNVEDLPTVVLAPGVYLVQVNGTTRKVVL